jgi:hypothetical protein
MVFFEAYVWPQSWNSEIVERWNDGFSKDITHLKLYRRDQYWHLPKYRNIPRPIIALKLHYLPNIPAFQHSNWGGAPYLNLYRLKHG